MNTPKMMEYIIFSIQFCHTVVSDSLRPHALQHSRPPCPSATPRAYSNSRPLSQWYHPIILSSVVPSPPFFNLSLHQGRFEGVSSSHQGANILEFQLQHQSSQWTFGTDFLWAGLVGSHNILQDAYQSTHNNSNKEQWESHCITTLTWHISD